MVSDGLGWGEDGAGEESVGEGFFSRASGPEVASGEGGCGEVPCWAAEVRLVVSRVWGEVDGLTGGFAKESFSGFVRRRLEGRRRLGTDLFRLERRGATVSLRGFEESEVSEGEGS